MVTVFTPVYNRKEIIKNLYNSLKIQTDQDFEWVIVDDGSTDNLVELVKIWMSEKDGLNIKYKRVDNGGKHRAINIGVKMAVSDAFFIVDSDDYLANDAIEFVNMHFVEIAEDESFAGISGLKSFYKSQEIIGGNPAVREFVDATNLERKKYHLLGDKAEVYKTSLLRKYPFPEFEGEKYITESIVWNQIAIAGYKLRWFNKVTYYAEYQGDGLTRNMSQIRRKNPMGWAAYIKLMRSNPDIDEKEILMLNYFYYENLCNIYSDYQICEWLSISTKEYQMLKNRYLEITRKICNLLTMKEIDTIALYGDGTYGNRFMTYLDEIGKDVRYVIDKRYEQNETKNRYSLNDALPEVDSICITLKNIQKDSEEELHRKLPKAYIWKLQDIDKVVF